jgi:G3E family GTPase
VKQACVADILLLTKTDIAAVGDVTALRARLNQLNPIAHTQDVVRGDVDPDWLFNIAAPGAPRARDFSGLVEQVAAHADHHHDHAAGDHHGAGAHGDIRSFSVIRDEKVTFAGLEVWMGMLGEVRGPDLLRIKGIVNVGGRPIVVQAVQHMFHPLHELPEWPDDDRRSRLVFITRNVAREQIERTLDALSLDISPRTKATAINPDEFRQFVAAASKFR